MEISQATGQSCRKWKTFQKFIIIIFIADQPPSHILHDGASAAGYWAILRHTGAEAYSQ